MLTVVCTKYCQTIYYLKYFKEKKSMTKETKNHCRQPHPHPDAFEELQLQQQKAKGEGGERHTEKRNN